MRKKKGAFGVVFQEVLRLNTLPIEAKGLYAYLASLSDVNDECYPTVDLIRHELGISKDRYYKYMRILVAAGVVEKVQIKTDGCRFGKNVYKLTHEVRFSVEPYTEKSDTKSSTMKNPTMKSSAMKNPTMKSSAMKNPTMKNPTMKNPTAESKDTNNKSINNKSINNKNNKQCASDNAPKVSKAAINDFFESIWKLYPNKKGKGQVSDSKKKALYDIGYDELSRAIERYKAGLAQDEWRKLQYGSTFFNSGYIDYLDANYTEPEQTELEEGDRSIYKDDEEYRRLWEELGYK